MGDTAGPRVDPSGPAASVRIEVEALAVLSRPLARDGVPVVSRVTVTCPDGPVRAARLHLEVRDDDGPLGATDVTTDLRAGATVLTAVDLRVDAAALDRSPGARAGTIEVRVEADGQELGRAGVPVQLLGAEQWLASPLPLALETLAAHVRPQDPAVAALVGAATDLLDSQVGVSAPPGELFGAERIDRTSAAIVEALRLRGVRHAGSPASWARRPQRVRTPTEVLDDRLGSTLDTVVVLAAALEHAGIRPLLWIAEDHAFLGYWRTPHTAESTATTEVDGLVELVDGGHVQLIEATMLTASAAPATFGDLHRRPYASWLAGDPGRIAGVTDVDRARRDGVRPLPVAGPEAAPRAVTTPREEWADQLIEPSPDSERVHGSGLPLTVPDGQLAALADLLTGGTAITLLPSDQIGARQRERGLASAADLPPGELTDLLVRHGGLYADVPGEDYPELMQQLAEGTGLHVTLGSLAWEVAGRPVRSPVVLVPVTLGQVPGTGATRLVLDAGRDTAVDPALLTALRRQHGIVLPGAGGPIADGAGTDAVLEALRSELAREGLPFAVAPSASLALLPALPPMWHELHEHWSGPAANPLLARLAGDSAEPFPDPAPDADPDLDALATGLPLPADGSQLRAIAEVAAGRTVVLEGAPGTGKSQTVVNLVASSVTAGRRVLVVAAGRAALDTLAGRLAAAGLGPLTLDLHGTAGGPAGVRAQLRGALQRPAEPTAVPAVADPTAARRVLDDYARRLHEPNSAGFSLYTAPPGPTAGPLLPTPVPFVSHTPAQTVTAVRRALAAVGPLAEAARPRPGHPWGFLDRPRVDAVSVQLAVVALDEAIDALPGDGPLADALAAARTPGDLGVLATALAGVPVPLAVLDQLPDPAWQAAVRRLLGEVSAFLDGAHPALDVAVAEALDLPLADLAAAADSAVSAGRFGRARRLAAVLDQLDPVLRADAEIELADVPALTASLLATQTAARRLAARAAAVPGLRVPADWNPFREPDLVDDQLARLVRLGDGLAGAGPATAALRTFLADEPATDPAAAGLVTDAQRAVADLVAACGTTDRQLAAWAGDAGLLPAWTATRPDRTRDAFVLPSLGHWLALLRRLELLNAAGLGEARAALLAGVVPADEAAAAFERGLAAAALPERHRTTRLGADDAAAQQRAAEQFVEGLRAGREQLVGTLPDRWRSSLTPDARAALRQELDLPGGSDVRGLIAAAGDLLPCVLADPEAVARLLPATAGLFDLVVLDDASQLAVADAVGALGRARTSVVVGDSRQLPPRRPGTPGLLDAALAVGVPRLELTWHHRSRDESLIAATNAQSYGAQLATFPAPGAGRAVHVVRVPGTFHRSGLLPGTNPVEARAVVAEIRRRFDAAPGALPSLAVVTLHPQQLRLIERLLRDLGDDRLTDALDRADGLVLAEVDDVQGLERDAVLLSLGCSAADGDAVPLDLGPLGRAGGERRLTVAVTRARRQVVVFASFDPAQLPADRTSMLGVRHLAAYLDAAAGAPLPRAATGPDQHRDAIAAALRERGLAVRTDVGASPFRIDLTVARPADPDTPVLAVLLDGPAWARRGTATDREAVPAEALERGQRWPAVEWVRLPAWLADRDAVLDRLVHALEAAGRPPTPLPTPAAVEVLAPPPPPALAPVTRPAPHPAPVPEPPAVEPVRTTARPSIAPVRLDGEQPFVPWRPGTAGKRQLLRRLDEPAVAELVRRVLSAGIAAEGPVHRDRLVQRTAGAFGAAQPDAERRAAIAGLLPDPSATFLWPDALDPETWTGFRRTATGAERPLAHVCPEEIGNAMVALCRTGEGVSRDELFARTLAVFGAGAPAPDLVPLLEAGLAHAVRSSRVTRQSAGLLIRAA